MEGDCPKRKKVDGVVKVESFQSRLKTMTLHSLCRYIHFYSRFLKINARVFRQSDQDAGVAHIFNALRSGVGFSCTDVKIARLLILHKVIRIRVIEHTFFWKLWERTAVASSAEGGRFRAADKEEYQSDPFDTNTPLLHRHE